MTQAPRSFGKRLLAMVVVLALLLTYLPVRSAPHVHAEAVEGNVTEPGSSAVVSDDTQILGQGQCGENLTWVLYDSGELIISGTGAMYDFTDDSSNVTTAPWFPHMTSLKKVTVENGVTTLGNHAFQNCVQLREISLPNTLTRIGVDAFWYCTNLTSIEIPNSVTDIDSGAFWYCRNLANITMSSNITYLGVDVFYNCYSLQKNHYDNAYYLGNETNPYALLLYCYSSISSCIIHEDTRVIAPAAFQSSGIITITIPDSVVFIGGNAFRGCSKLTHITIGTGLIGIDTYTFYLSNKLNHILYKGSEERWNSLDIPQSGNEKLFDSNTIWTFNATGEELPNGICKQCCTHYWNGDATCDLCGGLCDHLFDDACDNYCERCGTVDKNRGHDWSKKDGVCAACGNACETLFGHLPESKKHECRICGKALTTCTYDNDNDTDCNICGAIREVSKNYVAQVGEYKFETLEAALAADGKVILLSDITATGFVNATGETIDLNGFTLTADILGTIEMNGGTFKTSQYTMVGEDGLYKSADATFTVSGEKLDVTIHSGTMTLSQTKWYTGEGQTLKIEAGATFVIPEGCELYVNGSNVIVEGTAANFGTLTLANGAHVKGDIAGTFQMAGGTYETSKYVMIGATAGKYLSSDAVFTIIPNETMDMVVSSGTITLDDPDWWTLAGQTLTIAKDATFIVPEGKNINVQGTVIVEGNVTVDGTVTLYNEDATVTASEEGLNIVTQMAGHKVVHENGIYKVVEKPLPSNTALNATSDVIVAKPGDKIKVTVAIVNNPGYISGEILMHATEGLSILCDYSDPQNPISGFTTYMAGSVIAYGETGIISWQNVREYVGDTILFDVEFIVAEDAAAGEYTIFADPRRDTGFRTATGDVVEVAGDSITIHVHADKDNDHICDDTDCDEVLSGCVDTDPADHICDICRETLSVCKDCLTEHTESGATCTEAGNTAYWSCNVCGKYYDSEDAANEIEEGSWVTEALNHKNKKHYYEAAPGYTNPGNTEYWACPDCGKFFNAAGEEIEKDSWIIPPRGTPNKVYVSDSGNDFNTGLTADQAFKTLQQAYRYLAVYHPDSESTIIVCGQVTINSDVILDTYGVTGKVTITSLDGETNYAAPNGAKANGAQLYFACASANKSIYFGAKTELNNITMTAERSKKSAFIFTGLDMVFGENITTNNDNAKDSDNKLILFKIFCATSAPTENDVVNVEIKSGDYNTVFMGGNTKSTNGNVNLTVDGASVDVLYSGPNSSSSNKSIGKDMDITVKSGSVRVLYTVPNVAGTVDNIVVNWMGGQITKIQDKEGNNSNIKSFTLKITGFDGFAITNPFLTWYDATVRDTNGVSLELIDFTGEFASKKFDNVSNIAIKGNSNVTYVGKLKSNHNITVDEDATLFLAGHVEGSLPEGAVVDNASGGTVLYKIVWGDADGDEEVTENDATLIKQYRAGLIDASALNLELCDLNNNGKVDAYDAYLIQIFLAGRIDKFPCQN